MPLEPMYIAPARFDDPAQALEQVRDIYRRSVQHLRDALHAYVAGADPAQRVRACYPFVRVRTETVARAAQSVASLAQSMPAQPSAERPLPEVTYTFTCTPGWRVLRFTAREALSEPFECAVFLAAEDLTADPDAMLGRNATLTLARDSHQRRFHGVVRRVEHLGVAHGHRMAKAVVVPALWALSQRVDTRIFQNVTALAVVQAVLDGAGVYRNARELALQGTLLTREYCVQYRESDLAFVMRLLEEEGITWWIRHDDEHETLVLTDHDTAWAPIETFDGHAVPVAGPEVATHTTETVRHLDWGHELRATSAVVRDFDFTRPALDLTQRAPRAAGDARSVYTYPGEVVLDGYSDPAYASDNTAAQASLRHLAERALAQRGRGEGTVTVMAPGATFELEGHGRADLDGRHLLIAVEHAGHVPEELTGDTQHAAGTPRYEARFECQRADVPLRPRRVTSRPVVHGMQTATVVGPDGEEIYTDEHGRVKVQFHWDRLGTRDANSSCWMRVLQPWAGAGWGFVFIPRVGMEVVVHFLEGNPDRPVVLGSLYNGQNRPPYELPADKTRSTLKTHSSPGGGGFNELRFEDLAGSEEVFIHAQKDMNEVVEHDHTTTVHRHQTNTVDVNHTESVGGNQSLSVSGNRSKSVQHNEESHITQNRTETVGGKEDITVRGTRTERVTGKETIELHDARVTTIDKADALTVKTQNHTVTVSAGNDVLEVTGQANHHATVHYHVTGDQEVKLTQGNHSITMNAQGIVVAATGQKIRLANSSGSVELKDNKLTLQANNEVSIVCGASSISLKNDGTIAIAGAKKVDMQSSGAGVTCEPAKVAVHGPQIAAQATGTHEISGAVVKIN